ncbi:MAG TPA: hypothetical protein EYQ50_23485 [Verrucomicrobiales bacterium]|nr:hypothetical protein [Verrucomicrobiales bacterium]
MAFNEILRGCENPIEGIKGLRAQSDLLRQKLPAKSIPETVREEGFEHQVFDFPENPERLLKATKPGRYGIHPYFVFAVDEWDGKGYLQSMIALHPSVKRLRPARHDWNHLLKPQA